MLALKASDHVGGDIFQVKGGDLIPTIFIRNRVMTITLDDEPQLENEISLPEDIVTLHRMTFFDTFPRVTFRANETSTGDNTEPNDKNESGSPKPYNFLEEWEQRIRDDADEVWKEAGIMDGMEPHDWLAKLTEHIVAVSESFR